jgi:hypothetical protein
VASIPFSQSATNLPSDEWHTIRRSQSSKDLLKVSKKERQDRALRARSLTDLELFEALDASDEAGGELAVLHEEDEFTDEGDDGGNVF